MIQHFKPANKKNILDIVRMTLQKAVKIINLCRDGLQNSAENTVVIIMLLKLISY